MELTERKKGLTDQGKIKAKQTKALYLSEDPVYSVREICRMVGISSRTLYAYLKHEGVELRS